MSYIRERLQRFQSGVGVLSKDVPGVTKGLLGIIGAMIDYCPCKKRP